MTEALTRIESSSLAGQEAKNSRDAVALYIGSLKSAKSRYTMTQALARAADAMENRTAAESHEENKRRAYACEWSQIRAHHITAIQARLGDQFKPRTVRKIIAAVRGVAKQCRSLRLMDAEDYRDICDLKPVPFDANAEPKGRALKEEEFFKLAIACRADESAAGVRDAALLVMAYAAALRRFEIVGLDFKDWDSEEMSVRVRSGKGKKERKVYLSESGARVLSRWIELRGPLEPGAPLFVPINKSGKVGTRRITDQTVFDVFRKRGLQAGLESFSPHDLRRTAISDLLDRDVDIATAAAIAGHSSIQTTAKYDRRKDKAKQKAAGKLIVPF